MLYDNINSWIEILIDSYSYYMDYDKYGSKEELKRKIYSNLEDFSNEDCC